jgi:hypothetical protein
MSSLLQTAEQLVGSIKAMAEPLGPEAVLESDRERAIYATAYTDAFAALQKIWGNEPVWREDRLCTNFTQGVQEAEIFQEQRLALVHAETRTMAAGASTTTMPSNVGGTISDNVREGSP